MEERMPGGRPCREGGHRLDSYAEALQPVNQSNKEVKESMATVKGQNLRIFVGGRAIIAALDCQLQAPR